jgi:4,5-DOPA dioxygenase extradiol
MTALMTLGDLVQAREVSSPGRMPVLFIGHGSPMNAVRDNTFTQHLKAWGHRLTRPSAILCVSAHWLTPGATAVGIQTRPRTIRDFGGFPRELYEIEYPAPGAPALAREAAAMVRSVGVAQTEEWGFDHGTWTVLHHLFPLADVPAFQLSIDYARPAGFHYAIGRELSALRDKGVLIIGSGNVVHNLRATDRDAEDGLTASRDWAQVFDADVKAALEVRDDSALVGYQRLRGSRMAVPTPDHYFPFLYSLGAGVGEKAVSVFEGFQAGTLGMRCLQFG